MFAHNPCLASANAPDQAIQLQLRIRSCGRDLFWPGLKSVMMGLSVSIVAK